MKAHLIALVVIAIAATLAVCNQSEAGCRQAALVAAPGAVVQFTAVANPVVQVAAPAAVVRVARRPIFAPRAVVAAPVAIATPVAIAAPVAVVRRPLFAPRVIVNAAVAAPAAVVAQPAVVQQRFGVFGGVRRQIVTFK